MSIKFQGIFLILIFLLASFLRLYKLDKNPLSPYWEEAALGYDAYSILKTGKDHHGNTFPLVAFESFGDWKPSLYFYATALSEAVFGLNTFAVRLPSALAGIGTVILAYFIVKILIKDKTKASWLALISSLLLAIVPWHVLISRVGFETNLGFFLGCLGLYLFLKAVKTAKNRFNYYLIVSFFAWGLSFYAYHASRGFIPLLILGLLIWYRKWVKHHFKQILPAGFILGLMLMPIGIKINSPEIRQRFGETSALATLEPILLSNEAIASDGNTRIAKLIHHRYWYYGKIIIKNYLSHFEWDYLFINGDSNRRHSVGLVGQLYWLYAPFLLLGLYFLIRNKEYSMVPIVLFTLLAPVPAAITTAVPHALRSLPMVLGLCVIPAYGVVSFIIYLNKTRFMQLIFGGVIGIALTFQFIQFWHYYWHDYRIKYADQWQDGYQELMAYIGAHKQEYDQIIITRELGRPAMYYWFYNQTDPRLVQSWNQYTPKDQGEYLQFENLYFGIEPDQEGRKLRVSATNLKNYYIKKIIFGLSGKPVFYLHE